MDSTGVHALESATAPTAHATILVAPGAIGKLLAVGLLGERFTIRYDADSESTPSGG
jgi:hypothetical protein